MAERAGKVSLGVEVRVESVRVVDLRPGDRLVVMFPHRVSMAEVERLRAVMSEWAAGHEVLVLDGGASLEVVREGGYGGETTDADGVEEAGGEPGQTEAE
ncbi:MAG TPA: hypothetical protein PL105_06865 [Caldilineaceae bacterium]|nr:hypothetical protein [Caldilineaceae bacterium]